MAGGASCSLLKQKDRLAAVSPKSHQVCFNQTARATAFRFLRQPSRPNAHERKLETKFWRYEISDLGRGYKIFGQASRLCNDFPISLSIVIFLHFATYDAHKASSFSIK